MKIIVTELPGSSWNCLFFTNAGYCSLDKEGNCPLLNGYSSECDYLEVVENESEGE